MTGGDERLGGMLLLLLHDGTDLLTSMMHYTARDHWPPSPTTTL